MKNIILLLVVSISVPYTAYAQPENTPQAIVTYAISALQQGQIEKLLPITENSELRKTKELLEIIGNNPKKREAVVNQYKLIKSWKIIDTTEKDIQGRHIAVVYTRWVSEISVEHAPKNMVIDKNNPSPSEQIMYVDYMLEQKDGRWKIISRRAR